MKNRTCMIFLLCLMICFSMCACGSKDEANNNINVGLGDSYEQISSTARFSV